MRWRPFVSSRIGPQYTFCGSKRWLTHRAHHLLLAARNFKLLDELEAAEKSSKGGADISMGLSRPDDTFMSDWTASIFAQAVRAYSSCLLVRMARREWGCLALFWTPVYSPCVRFATLVPARWDLRSATGESCGNDHVWHR